MHTFFESLVPWWDWSSRDVAFTKTWVIRWIVLDLVDATKPDCKVARLLAPATAVGSELRHVAA
jgi:hypothetical protein